MQSNTFDTLVIDDEVDVRSTLVQKLSKSNYWNVIGEADSVTTAVHEIVQKSPEVVFLDIKLREGDAFKVLNMVKNLKIIMPAIVLNTGYAEFEYAQRVVNEYGDHVVRLLKKPFWEDWETKELQIVTELMKNKNSDDVTLRNDKLVIRVGNQTHFINISAILFIEVETKNSAKTKICTENKVVIANKTLIKIQQFLPKNFVKISRQTIVNLDYVSLFDHEDHVLCLKGLEGRQFYVGMKFRKEVLG